MVMIPVTFLNEFRCITDEMKQKMIIQAVETCLNSMKYTENQTELRAVKLSCQGLASKRPCELW